MVLAITLLEAADAMGAGGGVAYDQYLHVVGFVPTEARVLDVAVSGSLAVVVLNAPDYGRLVVVSLADPWHPVVLGSTSPAGLPSAVTAAGSFAYVSESVPTPAIEVFDFTDPRAPARVGFADVGFRPHDIAIDGGNAYVVGDSLAAYDISDPLHRNPMWRWSRPLDPGVIAQLTIDAASRAYVRNYYSLRVFDLGSTQVIGGPHALWSGVYPSIAVVGTHAYTPSVFNGQIYVLDTESPTVAPTLVNLGRPDATLTAVVGGASLAATGTDSDLQSSDSWSFFQFDVASNPASPALEGQVDQTTHSQEGLRQMARYGNLVCVTDYVGLLVIDASSLLGAPVPPPVADGILNTDIAIRAYKVYALAQGDRRLRVYDISTDSPRSIGNSFPTKGVPHSLALRGTTAVVAEGGGSWTGIEIVNASDPSNIRQLGVVPMDQVPLYVTVEGRFAYAASRDQVALIDLDQAQIADTLQTGTGADGAFSTVPLAVSDSYLCTLKAAYRLVSGAHPERIGGLPESFFSTGIAVRGDVAYLADGSQGLTLIDLSQRPPSPFHVFPLPGGASHLTIVGTTAYVVGFHRDTLWILNLEDPRSPKLVGNWHAQQAFRVAADCARLVVAHNSAGLGVAAPREAGEGCPVPVLVQDFQAGMDYGVARLAWRIPPLATQDLVGVEVQRAETQRGPFAAVTPSLLPPQVSMSFVDRSDPPASGGTRWYRLALVGTDGSVSFAGPVSTAPAGNHDRSALLDLAESADGERVAIGFRIGTAGPALQLAIYDVRGRRVWSPVLGAAVTGAHTVAWDRRDNAGVRVARGVYFVELNVGASSDRRKLVLVH